MLGRMRSIGAQAAWSEFPSLSVKSFAGLGDGANKLECPRFGDVDYGDLEEFTQLTLTVDGKDPSSAKFERLQHDAVNIRLNGISSGIPEYIMI